MRQSTNLAFAKEADLEGFEFKEDPLDYFKKIIMPRLPLYQTLALRGGFWIEFGDKTCFDHSRGTIVLNIMDFAGDQKGISPSIIDYKILHEIGHLKELYDDPEGYRDIIETGNEKYGEAAFRLYNCLMDVYVNTNTTHTAPVYGSQNNFSDEVKDFYRDQCFNKRDFSSYPEFAQFAHYLLNLGMGVADDITLSPAVQQRIDRGLVDVTGIPISYKEFLDVYMRPPVEASKSDLWQATVSQRKNLIDRMIRPDFEQFLLGDLEAGRAIEVPSISGVGSIIDPGNLKEIFKNAMKVKKEGKPTAADRELERQLNSIGEDINMPVDDLNNFISIYKRAQSLIKRLAKVWDELRFTAVSQGISKVGHYVQGCDLDIQKTISNYPQVLSSPSDARVMYRRFPYEERLPAPRHFNLRLVVDTSGSMGVFEEVVRETVVAFGASLYVKNQESKLVSDPIKCGLEVHRFSGGAKVALPCTDEITVRKMMEFFPEITMGGGTSDHLALGEINKSIDAKASERIKKGELVEIVIEITDGDTSSPSQTIKELRRLERKGVLVGAISFQYPHDLPDVLEENLNHLPENVRKGAAVAMHRMMRSTGTLFEQIWNHSNRVRGLSINDPQELPRAMAHMIQRFISESPELSNAV